MRTSCSSRVKGLPTLATALEVAHRRLKATVGASLPAQTYRPAVEVDRRLAQCPGGRRVEKSKFRLASPLGVLLLDNHATERMLVRPSASPRAPPPPALPVAQRAAQSGTCGFVFSLLRFDRCSVYRLSPVLL
jgi:hypothetical protein